MTHCDDQMSHVTRVCVILNLFFNKNFSTLFETVKNKNKKKNHKNTFFKLFSVSHLVDPVQIGS